MERHFKNCKIEIGGCLCALKHYWLIFALTVLIFGFEVLGGVISGSLSLLSDAGHVLGDAGAILAALLISYLVYQRPDLESRLRELGAYIHGTLLILVAGWVILEAVRRAQNPQEVIAAPMMLFAAAGGAANYFQHQLLKRVGENITRTGMSWHILSDLWQSAAVVITGAAIQLTGRPEIDLMVSFGIALVIAFGGGRLINSGRNAYHNH